mgnify:CR=1 FL=1
MFRKRFTKFLNLNRRAQTRVYLDFASRTPIDTEVLRSMTNAYREFAGNPSALYKEGVYAKNELMKAKESIAVEIGAHGDEIICTSGGTESDNVAILGVIKEYKSKNPTLTPHILISAIEHSAIFEIQKESEILGVKIETVPVDSEGVVDMQVLSKMLRPETILVSIMYVNNEIGTVEPIEEIAKVIRRYKKELERFTDNSYPLFHTDAVQALNYIPLRVAKLGVDLLSISGGKIYGPHGTGLLFVKRGTPIKNIFFGGSQEGGMRPGTESVPHIIGLSEAVTKASLIRHAEVERLGVLQKYLLDELPRVWPGLSINGSLVHRIVNNVHMSVPDFSSELLVIELDALGFAVSSKSGCKSTDPEMSHVLKVIRNTKSSLSSADIRITMGRTTTRNDIEKFLLALKKITKKYNIR